jgi:hypothetical protein
MATDPKRVAAREKVAAEARSGNSPSSLFAPEDLAWAFVGCEGELEHLEARAAERREEQKAARLSTEISALVPAILAEWDADEKAARRARAYAEARRRVGSDEAAAS